MRDKRFVALILSILAVFFAALLLTWGALHFFTGSSQLARAVVWLDSDIQDYRRFPARRVQNAPPVFNFQQPGPELRQKIAPVFEQVAAQYGGQAKRRDFESLLERSGTVAFLVIQDDTLLYEGYFHGYQRESTVTSFSISKSFLSALVGIAIQEGFIASLEEPVTSYAPELLERDARYREINLRHLLSMSSGIRYIEDSRPWRSDYFSIYYAPDLRAVALSSPIEAAPGKAFRYNNFNPLLIGLVLERATGMHVAEYLQEKIWKPLGMEAGSSWSLDSLESGFEKMESGLNGRAIDFAKFGRLYLRRGEWNGQQIVPAAWVETSTRLDALSDPNPYYQYFWWLNPNQPGHFFAHGKLGQYIYIIPEQNLLILRFGRSERGQRFTELFEDLARKLGEVQR